MKKFITFMALIAMVASVQAAAFEWGTSGVAVKFDGSTISNGSATGYLVYLGSASSESEAMGRLDFEGNVVNNATVDNKTTSTGFGAGTITKDYGGEGSVNDYYAMFITYTDTASGTTYYNVAGNAYQYTLGAGDIGNPTNFTFDFGTKNPEGTKLVAGGGWTPVPEPATAALAIAGLAMLIKRRK